jgi:glycosyltransferase involved in cell wall biosynthesis
MDEIKLEKPKQVLYLSYDGMTDPLGQSQVLPYLIGLTKQGYRFSLISFEKKDRFEKHKAHIQSICDSNNISWFPLPYSQKNPLFTTLYDVTKMKKLALKLHKVNPFSIVHCRSYISAIVGLYFKQKLGVKFIFDMRGFWADERVDGKLWDLKKPIYNFVYKYFKKKERTYFEQSDYTISLTANAKTEIESWQLNPQPKIQIIPCCVDLKLFDPKQIDVIQRNTLKEKLEINEDAYVLGYIGSIGTWYMLPEMLDFYTQLKLVKPKAIFLFVTNEKKETIINLALEKGINPKDIIISSCLHQEVPLYTSLFDYSIFFIRPTYSKKASSPTKQGEIMAMGIPVVCNTGVGDTDLIVRNHQAGILIETFEGESYKKAISQMEGTINIEGIQTGALHTFSLQKGIESYLKVYQSIEKN